MSCAPVKQRHTSYDSKERIEKVGGASIKKKFACPSPPTEGGPAKNIHTQPQSLLHLQTDMGLAWKG
jgi:hypothetical protein